MGDPHTKRGIRKRLSPRETEILKLYAEGKRRGEVATELFISPRTVDAHLSNARVVLGARTVPQLVALFVCREEA